MSRTRTQVWTSFRGLAMAGEPMTSGPVALLELLARPAPARVVAPDLLGRLDPALLDRRRHVVGRVDRVAVGADRRAGRGRAAGRRGQRARLRRVAAAAVRDLAGTRRGAARPRRPRLVLLRRGRAAVLALDLHLDVEDHPGEVRPDRVHQVGEELERLVLVGDDRL